MCEFRIRLQNYVIEKYNLLENPSSSWKPDGVQKLDKIISRAVPEQEEFSISFPKGDHQLGQLIGAEKSLPLVRSKLLLSLQKVCPVVLELSEREIEPHERVGEEPSVTPKRLVVRVELDELLVEQTFLSPERQSNQPGPGQVRPPLVSKICVMKISNHILVVFGRVVKSVEVEFDHLHQLLQILHPLAKVLELHRAVARDEFLKKKLPVCKAAVVRDVALAPLGCVVPVLAQNRIQLLVLVPGLFQTLNHEPTMAPGVAIVGVPFSSDRHSLNLVAEQVADVLDGQVLRLDDQRDKPTPVGKSLKTLWTVVVDYVDEMKLRNHIETFALDQFATHVPKGRDFRIEQKSSEQPPDYCRWLLAFVLVVSQVHQAVVRVGVQWLHTP